MIYFDQKLETMPREKLESFQLEKLQHLFAEILPRNQFYSTRLRASHAKPADFNSLASLKTFPFTTKQDLIDDQQSHPPFGTNLTYAITEYTRYHQTSGTTGPPLKVPDTAHDWDWWGRCWAFVFSGAGLTARDRVFLAFGFGPFIGFWAAVEGARQIGAMMVPGGARESLQRLELIRESECTALCCTPTYALRLAEVAHESRFDLRKLPVRATVHAGEPGANVPATKKRIEEAWGAKCYDHAGATEVGAHSFECEAQPDGIHINEAEFIAEVIDPETGDEVPVGEQGELVLTNLGRFGFPVIRYRTGDIVKLADERCDCGRTFVRCEGGVIGRYDDMITVRGVNVYPSAIENLVRAVDAVSEFRVTVRREGELDLLQIEMECTPGADSDGLARKVADSISTNLGLRPRVEVVPYMTLPRFELKARRFVVAR